MNRYTVTVGGTPYQVTLLSKDGTSLSFSCEGTEYHVTVASARDRVVSRHASPLSVPPPSSSQGATPSQPASQVAGAITAPIPGIVSALKVSVGDSVAKGDTVVIIEAMKMENPIRALCAGVVTELLVKVGEEVQAGKILLRLQ